jgi:hypothetical protein
MRNSEIGIALESIPGELCTHREWNFVDGFGIPQHEMAVSAFHSSALASLASSFAVTCLCLDVSSARMPKKQCCNGRQLICSPQEDSDKYPQIFHAVPQKDVR